MVPPQLASPLGRQQASSLFLSKVARGLVPQPFSALPTLPCALCPVPSAFPHSARQGQRMGQT